MSDILGHKLPEGKVSGTLAAVAIVSIPVAAVIGLGMGARALYRRLRRPLTPEEQLERLKRAAYRDGISE